LLRLKKVFFSHLKWNKNEMKRKNEKEAKKDKVKFWENL
jgi:hypothetical protein